MRYNVNEISVSRVRPNANVPSTTISVTFVGDSDRQSQTIRIKLEELDEDLHSRISGFVENLMKAQFG